MRLTSRDEPTASPAHVSSTVVPAPSASPTAPPASCPTETNAIIQAANNESLPLSRFPSVDTGDAVDIPLVSYSVSGDQLSAPLLAKGVPADLLPYQTDFVAQHDIWKLFTRLIPSTQRSMLAQFQIMTDGPGGVLSAVEQTGDDPQRWVLESDIADAVDTRNLAFTLLHEFGHLLTLNAAQVPPDLNVFNTPNSNKVLDRAVAACSTYFPGEGCSEPKSYVNAFFSHFWPNLYNEWDKIDQISDDGRRDAKLHSFYRKYEDQFVDSYAVTSPVEDIAETWAYYVLSPKPSGNSIADQKIAFFYAYPELVALREQIRTAVCAAKP